MPAWRDPFGHRQRAARRPSPASLPLLPRDDLMQARWGTHGDHWLIALTRPALPECLN